MASDQQNAKLRQRLELMLKDVEEDRKESLRIYPQAHEKLEAIASALRSNASVLPVTLRQLLSWFGANYRGPRPNHAIRWALAMHDLRLEPDLNAPTLDETVQFRSGAKSFELPEAYTFREPEIGRPIDSVEANILNAIWAQALSDQLAEWVDENPNITESQFKAKVDEFQKMESHLFLKLGRSIPTPTNLSSLSDATLPASRLETAKTEPLSISPNHTITQAITIMEQNDFSQLPVVVNRTVKGIVNWRSIARHVFRGGGRDSMVQDCMELPPPEVAGGTPLIKAIDAVLGGSCILVRNQSNNVLSGIVTTWDLSKELKELSEPFLLLMEIENHLRWLILNADFTIEDLRSAADPRDQSRYIRNIDDLTLAEYIILLQKKETPSKIKLLIDLQYLIRQLTDVRLIRNNIMHFNLNPISSTDLGTLRKNAEFLRRAQDMKELES